MLTACRSSGRDYDFPQPEDTRIHRRLQTHGLQDPTAGEPLQPDLLFRAPDKQSGGFRDPERPVPTHRQCLQGKCFFVPCLREIFKANQTLSSRMMQLTDPALSDGGRGSPDRVHG